MNHVPLMEVVHPCTERATLYYNTHAQYPPKVLAYTFTQLETAEWSKKQSSTEFEYNRSQAKAH